MRCTTNTSTTRYAIPRRSSIPPLFKYHVTGRDATKLVNRIISRDINKVAVDQVIYCCWCDQEGKVIDDGTITRLGENEYRWTAADPSLRWFQQNALGLDVAIEDISRTSGRPSRCKGQPPEDC